MNKYLLFLLLLLLCSGCTTAPPPAPAPAPKADSPPHDAMNDLSIFAISLAETPYRYGGDSPETGFDCSGFVRYVFQKVLALQLPRTSLEMSRVGEPLPESQLQPGDLVFFNTLRRSYSHVGIYVGDDRFVHAPKTGKAIAIVNMRENYWRTRYNGARRIAARQ